MNFKVSLLIVAACAAVRIMPFGQCTAAIKSVVQGENARARELEKIADALVTSSIGQTPDSTNISKAVSALETCQLFETVTVEQSQNDITFRLTPALFVRDVRISGEHPLFKDDIEKAMRLQVGDMYVSGQLHNEDSLITALYHREGFVSPDVNVTSYPHQNSADRIVQVSVDAGPFYRLDEIDISGNRAFSDLRLKCQMKSWRSTLLPGSAGRFISSSVSDDMKQLLAYYRSKGFADIAIADSTITDSVSRSVRLLITVNEGDRYSIQFPRWKQRVFAQHTLRKDIVLFTDGNRNNLGMRTSVRAMENRLKETGYLDAEIQTSSNQIQHSNYTERQVVLEFQRGKRYMVNSISIRGNSALNEKAIRAQMLSHDRGFARSRAYDPEKLKEDIFAVQTLYRGQGFLNAVINELTTIQNTRVDISLDINEGPRTLLRSIQLDSSQLAGVPSDKVITARIGDPLTIDLIKLNARTLQDKISEKGYPHAGVSSNIAIPGDSTAADVEFQISRGPLVTMGDVHFIGAFRTRQGILQRQVRTRPGQPMSLKRIIDTQKRLRNLGIFNSVRFRTIGLQEKSDTVHVFVQVAEKRPYYGMVGGGFQSDKGPFVNTRVGDLNIFGLNKEVWIGGEISQIGYSGETGLLGQTLFGSKIRALIELSGKKKSELNQEWGITSYVLSTGLTTPLGNRMLLGLNVNYEHRRLFYKPGASPQAEVDALSGKHPRNIVLVSSSFSYDRRDSFTRPRSGVYLSTSVDVSKNLQNVLDDFVKTRIETRGYITPLSALTLAGVIRGGYLRPYGKATATPVDHLFFLGGTSNIRGFGENLFHPTVPSGGSATLSASVEARWEIWFNFEITAFYDIGWLESDFASLRPDQFRSATGGGLRYITPIGPIGLLYGWKLGRLPDEDIGALHFSLGYTF